MGREIVKRSRVEEINEIQKRTMRFTVIARKACTHTLVYPLLIIGLWVFVSLAVGDKQVCRILVENNGHLVGVADDPVETLTGRACLSLSLVEFDLDLKVSTELSRYRQHVRTVIRTH
jgi:hypothetical protein